MAAVKFYSDDEEDDISTENASNEVRVIGRDSVIFAIECCEEMFSSEDEIPPFNRIINAIHDMMLNKIITSDKELHGVIFFGTEKNKNPGDFPQIYEWLLFDVPCINTILNLRKMQDYSLKKLKEEFGLNKGYQVSDVLWACSNMFSGSSFTLASKTLLIFPWNDNPHDGDDNARKRAKAKATDLLEHKVNVEVLSFNPHFKYGHLYKDITCDPENPEPNVDNPIDSIQNLYSFLLRKCTKQRPLTRVALRLGDNVALSVGVYTVARRAQKSDYVSIDTATNEEVSRKSNMVDNNTGEILMPSDIKFLQKWGGRDLVFEKEEVQRMRKIGQRGLTLVGFKPRSKAIKAWYHVRNAQFIYPDEKTTQGSATLFQALLKKCLEKDVVAICNFAARDTSPPRYVALLPRDEETDAESSEQISPPGFYVIFLPFADDIRKFDIPRDVAEPSSAQVEAAEAMIKRLRFPYDPENFDNPVIQTHYKNLETMALEKPDVEPIEDYTMPNYDMIEKKAGSLIRTFKDLAFPQGFSKKRGAGDRATGASAKRAKEEGVEIDVKEYIAQDKLGKLTVAALKEVCRNYNLKCTGKKVDLINTIEDYFKKQST